MKSNNRMSQFSLRAWVLILALAPTIVVGILLGTYFTINRFYELEETLLDKATSIIEPLALASEMGLASSDRESMKKMLTAAQMKNTNHILSIAIFDQTNQLFVTSHYHKDFENMRYKGPLSDLNSTEFTPLGDKLVVRTPIISHLDDSLKKLSTLSSSTTYRVSNSNASAANLLNQNNEKVVGYVAILINKESALLEQHRAAIAAFIIVLIGVQFNLLFTFRLVKFVNYPITEMVRVVAKIREGKLDTRLEGDLVGELDLLKRGINAMAGSLAEYHDEMQQNIDQATSDLRETLEQIEIQNVELDLAKKRALEASRIKSEFLANMSHELRTPLNGVIGFSRQLIKTPLHSSQLDYIKTIERSASNLLAIINDILDFSKLEAGKMVFEKLPFALRETMADTISIIAPTAKEKDLELVIDIDQNVPESVSGDAMRVSQIITNLVGNAIKFTDEGSITIKMSVVGEGENEFTLRCEVIDTGIGIDEYQQEYLFQAFGQADSSISRRFGGTGLGLVITKRLINQMGGQIGFTSSPNQGSNFWFILPLGLSQFEIGETLPIELLAQKTILLYEPRELTRDMLNRRLSDWKLDLTSVGQIEHLEHTLQQDSLNFDYMLISCHGFTSSQHIAKVLKQAKKHTQCLILLHDCIDQDVITSHLKPNTDLLLTTPISDLTLAKHLIYPPTPKSLEQSFEELVPNIEPEERINATVLAVDDNPANLMLIDTLLKELVLNVVKVKNGEEAIAQAKAHTFDLIFMDIQMPGIDGVSATKHIRKESMNRNTPIIAVTAHALSEEKDTILNSGMDGFLPKPIDEKSLKAVLTRWIAAPKFTHFDIHTLNWELCLTQANHKTPLALEMLQMLVDSLPDTKANIQEALQTQDQAMMLQTIHKLHGASCYCGIPTTQKLCNEIEIALKRGASTDSLEPEILELLDELTKVKSAASQVLSQLTLDQDNV